MIKTFVAAALLGTAAFGTASAEEVTLSRPIQAGSLHQGPLDMVAYWVAAADDALEVTATFRGRMPEEQPLRVVMPLQDGDSLSFGMPGYPRALYSFARSGGTVSIGVDVKPLIVASAGR